MVGNHWHDGTSLYGNYWVDRPPLLLWLNDLAGGVTRLRILGLTASVLTVLGAAWAAQLARGADAARWAAGAAALFGVAQWLGIARVNGEMLAAPFVAWSIALTLYAVTRTPWRVPAAIGAGMLAVGALSIKQSVIEAFVFALALALATAVQRRESRGVVVRVLAWGALGAVAHARSGGAGRRRARDLAVGPVRRRHPVPGRGRRGDPVVGQRCDSFASACHDGHVDCQRAGCGHRPHGVAGRTPQGPVAPGDRRDAAVQPRHRPVRRQLLGALPHPDGSRREPGHRAPGRPPARRA